MLEEHGMAIGLALLAALSLCGAALAWKAVRGVEEFREERHESFTGKGGKS